MLTNLHMKGRIRTFYFFFCLVFVQNKTLRWLTLADKFAEFLYMTCWRMANIFQNFVCFNKNNKVENVQYICNLNNASLV